MKQVTMLSCLLLAAAHPEMMGNGHAAVPAGVDYTGVGVEDAKQLFGGQMQSDKLKREKVLELAAKLNGDQVAAWLDGLKKGCLTIGFTEGSAKNARTEFSAIFKAYPITVNQIETEVKDGVEVQTVKQIVGKEVLPKAIGWNQMRDLARAINRAAVAQGVQTAPPNAGGTKGTKAMQDTTFDKIYEDVAKRGTPNQALQTLDLGITACSKYYSSFAAEEILKLREAEAALHTKVKAAAEKQKTELKTNPAVNTLTKLVQAVAPAEVKKEEVIEA